jgi:hypothetical protein
MSYIGLALHRFLPERAEKSKGFGSVAYSIAPGHDAGKTDDQLGIGADIVEADNGNIRFQVFESSAHRQAGEAWVGGVMQFKNLGIHWPLVKI